MSDSTPGELVLEAELEEAENRADTAESRLAAALSRVAEVERENDNRKVCMEAQARVLVDLQTELDASEDVTRNTRKRAADAEAAYAMERAAREKAEGERDEFYKTTVAAAEGLVAAESALSEARAETERIRTKWETCEAQWLDELNIASGEKGLAEGRAERAEAALSDARELLAGAVESLSVGGMHLSALKLRDALRAAGLLTTEASDDR